MILRPPPPIKDLPKIAVRTVAVTGATGFIGRYVVQTLLDSGVVVRALIRPTTSQPSILDAYVEQGQLIWIKGTLSDTDALRSLVDGADAVIHLAGLVKAKARADYTAVNVDATARLAAMASENGVRRFVLVSSMAAREPGLSDYAASKRAAEMALQDHGIGMAHSIIRAPAVFGPGDKATEPFIASALKGFLPVPGGRGWRDRKLSLVYAGDLANVLATAAVDGLYDYQTVSPATETSLTWPDFAAACSEALGKPVKARPIPLPLLRAVAAGSSVTSRLFGLGHLTLGKLREFLYHDWSAETRITTAPPLVDRLRETLDAYASKR